MNTDAVQRQPVAGQREREREAQGNGARLRELWQGFLLLTILVCQGHSSLSAAQLSGSNTGDVNIPDASSSGSPGPWVASTITISGAPSGATVTGIDVSFTFNHGFPSDLNIDLNADSSGSLGNYDLWQNQSANGGSVSRTVTSISTFNGLSPNRTWYLYARDEDFGVTGYIDAWSITVYYAVPNRPPTAPGTPTISQITCNGAHGTARLPAF